MEDRERKKLRIALAIAAGLTGAVAISCFPGGEGFKLSRVFIGLILGGAMAISMINGSATLKTPKQVLGFLIPLFALLVVNECYRGTVESVIFAVVSSVLFLAIQLAFVRLSVRISARETENAG